MTVDASRFAPLRNVGLFSAAYLLAASVFALQLHNWEFVYYIAVVLILACAAIAVHLRVKLSSGVVWGLSIWGLLHMVGGLVPVPLSWPVNGVNHVFYSWWLIPGFLKYDHVVHAYGFGISTWLCWQALRCALKNVYPTSGILVLCAIGGMGLGALNEVVEFVATLAIPNTNVGGYINTGWDLVANLVGSVTAAFLIGIFEGKKTQTT
ncbi:hypothetical protein COU78_03315 [Candidatus Peregrinibacteria bacterium CG10_big_fil_rev_8_21_14_0_10_49_24]|nr:MAG: hypothetical protein COV83_05135 [Candidatus Peregrinibacteria bacterium CG11_big_fil_rev_8_21_14_0_20_49_14]PIR51151.1 MAG: hypothetical protein COU78_03315 [Candidatus Peregrinibacteria bacterium CG10_big_fil_rev_8_21_14_0_10_49_24]PJA67190.1 MAG: hypothetical protein CO157_05470 [Candidatus Peregrinibacteria bacterium CG_4_9_14_3_um_filter_49_12]